jgi:SAM-dependent MidA family methyltransferase
MAAALHDPAAGYYARRIRTVGHRGDFTTTALLSPALPAAIASWALKILRERGIRDLIELGPGDGSLAAGILAKLPWWKRPRLHLVESSQSLRDVQFRKLGNKVTWHPDITSALASCGGRACLYSNEFFDAFPVRQFRFDEPGWSEAYTLPDSIIWEKADALPISSIFARTWSRGQVIEVHEAWRAWFEDFCPQWKEGAMLSIDYGALPESIYERRPRGSLRAYFHHQLITGLEILARPGHQDITADVNFTDLIACMPQAQHRLMSQRDFLLPFASATDAGDQHSIDPHGAGHSFLVLESIRC